MKLELVKTSKISSSKELLACYRSYRDARHELINKKIMEKLTKAHIKSCAKKLNTYNEECGVFVHNEEEFCMLIDYAILHHYIQKKNLVRRYAELTPSLTCVEKIILDALLEADFGVFGIVETLPYGGVLVENLLNGKNYLLMDEAMSQSTLKKSVIAGNYICFNDFIMSTGAMFELVKESTALLAIFLDDINKHDGYYNIPSQLKHQFIIDLIQYNFYYA